MRSPRLGAVHLLMWTWSNGDLWARVGPVPSRCTHCGRAPPPAVWRNSHGTAATDAVNGPARLTSGDVTKHSIRHNWGKGGCVIRALPGSNRHATDRLCFERSATWRVYSTANTYLAEQSKTGRFFTTYSKFYDSHFRKTKSFVRSKLSFTAKIVSDNRWRLLNWMCTSAISPLCCIGRWDKRR